MDVDGLQVKIIEHKVIYSNDFSVKFQLISETSSKVKNGTKVEKAIETITFQKYPSGWKMTEASNTPIDQKVIPNQAGRKVLFTGTLDGKIKK